MRYRVKGRFECDGNILEDLKGSPEYVGEDFFCKENIITSLEGAPKYVGGDFWISYNKRKFTEDEIRFVSNVKGEIYTFTSNFDKLIFMA